MSPCERGSKEDMEGPWVNREEMVPLSNVKYIKGGLKGTLRSHG